MCRQLWLNKGHPKYTKEKEVEEEKADIEKMNLINDTVLQFRSGHKLL